jgi:hypothetical protein
MHKLIDKFSSVRIITVEATASTSPPGSQRLWCGVAESVVLYRDTRETTFVIHRFASYMTKLLTDSRGELLLAKNLYGYDFLKVLVNDAGRLVNNERVGSRSRSRSSYLYPSTRRAGLLWRIRDHLSTGSDSLGAISVIQRGADN